MGAQRNACIMKCVAVIATLVVFASAAPMFSDVAEEVEFAQEEASPSLSSAVSFLQNVAPTNVNYHVARVAKHAELLQGYKAKAYAHNFESSKAAIKAALKSLTNEPTTATTTTRTSSPRRRAASTPPLPPRAPMARTPSTGTAPRAAPRSARRRPLWLRRLLPSPS